MLKKTCLVIILLIMLLITSRYAEAEADSNFICEWTNDLGEINSKWVTNPGTECPGCSCILQPPESPGSGEFKGGSPGTNPPASGGVVSLTNPLTGKATSKDIPTLLGNIIQYAMGIIGSLALVMFIFGGVTWMLSGGNQERVTKGKNIIIWAALGLAIIFTAYALVYFIIDTLGKSGS